MNCPVCKEPMVILELHEVEVDYCVSCFGVWLDAGELELLLEGAAEKEALLRSFEKTGRGTEKKRKCPRCFKKMNKVLCVGEVCLDTCPDNHGLWFDKGELMQVLKRGKLDSNSKIPKLLSEMFASEQKSPPTPL
ncbi:MAG: zf-TFIIB domain-containing protein [Deltaproteobacteria bacterium]|nr:zf-TFIIB domain-containing protein [Deltaproteobacteria bacterium]